MTQLLLVVITLTQSPDKQGAYTDAYNAAKNIVNGSPNVITMQQMLQQQHNVSIMLKQV